MREGKLCLSAVSEASRVPTAESCGQALPRCFGRSSREAREVAAALAPREDSPRRAVVTPVVRPAAVPAPALVAAPLAPCPAVPAPPLQLRAHLTIHHIPKRLAR
jgi:hypothetical protein